MKLSTTIAVLGLVYVGIYTVSAAVTTGKPSVTPSGMTNKSTAQPVTTPIGTSHSAGSQSTNTTGSVTTPVSSQTSLTGVTSTTLQTSTGGASLITPSLFLGMVLTLVFVVLLQLQ